MFSSKKHLSLLSTGSIQEGPSRHNRKNVDWDSKNKKTVLPVFLAAFVITYLERADLLALLCVCHVLIRCPVPGVLLFGLLIPDICPNLYYGHKVYHRTRISNVMFFSLKFMYLFTKLMTKKSCLS